MTQASTLSNPRLFAAHEELVGTWRRFGLAGPVYETIGPGDALNDGDRGMRVRLVETGEELDYKLTDILDDPGKS